MATAVDTRPDYTVTADRARAMLDQLTADTWRAVEHAVLDLKVTADTLFADIAEREGWTTVTVEQLDTQEWPAIGEILTGELQTTSPDVTETRLKVEELAATMQWAEVPFDRDDAFAEMKARADRMTAYMRADSSEDLPGIVVGTDPEPAAESRWSRWARTAGDVLAWIGGRS